MGSLNTIVKFHTSFERYAYLQGYVLDNLVDSYHSKPDRVDYIRGINCVEVHLTEKELDKLVFCRVNDKIATFKSTEVCASKCYEWILGFLISGTIGSLEETGEAGIIPSEAKVKDNAGEKDFSSVDIAVMISSQLEEHALYKGVKEKGWTFKQDCGGPVLNAGVLAGIPIAVAPKIHRINDINVLYIEAAGALIDWRIIETYCQRLMRPGIKIVEPGTLIRELSQLIKAEEKA